jgi:hypothetical protein
MAFHRLNMYPIDLDRDSPRCSPNLIGWYTFGRQISFYFASANDRRTGSPSESFGISQVVNCGMGNKDKVRRLKLV